MARDERALDSLFMKLTAACLPLERLPASAAASPGLWLPGGPITTTGCVEGAADGAGVAGSGALAAASVLWPAAASRKGFAAAARRG
jgi:hypothetical protein